MDFFPVNENGVELGVVCGFPRGAMLQFFGQAEDAPASRGGHKASAGTRHGRNVTGFRAPPKAGTSH